MSRALRSDVLTRRRPALFLLAVCSLILPAVSGFSFAQDDNSSKALITALKDSDSAVRQTAATLLGRLGDQAPVQAADALADALKDKDTDVRGAAVMALGRMGSKAKSAVPKVADVLADPNRDLRCAAALSLARLGKVASAALPQLTSMAQKDDRLERVYAGYALVAISGPVAGKVDSRIDGLIGFLSDANPQVRGAAAYVLGELGPDARAAIPALTVALGDNDKDVRKAGADALAEMGPAAKDAVPGLILLLQDKDARPSAQNALLEMGLAAGRTGMFFLTRTINQKAYNQVVAEYEADADKTGEATAPRKRLAEIQAFLENAQSIEAYRLVPTPDKQMKKVSFETAEAEYKAAVARAENVRKQYEAGVDNAGKPGALSEKELAVLRSSYLTAVIDAEDRLQALSRFEKDKLPIFHGMEVYGQTMVDKVQRGELNVFLQKSLHWDVYRQLPGFKARFGLRAVQGKRTIDLIISTDTNRINVYEGNETKGSITILAGTSPILDDLIRDVKKEADVKKEPEKKKEPDVKKEPEKKKEPDAKKEPEKKKEPVEAEVKFINSTKVKLNYELKDIGPSGVSHIELWYTLDGQSWKMYDPKFSGDPNQRSLNFDVVGDGRYGVTLIPRSGVGRSEKPPQPGDRPQLWFEVDTIRPVVKLETPVVGEGVDKGKLIITWSASDKNLEREPISLFYAENPTGPWQPIPGAEKLANTGRFVWIMPNDSPYQFHVKVEAADRARNIGEAVSAERISVDLSTPRAVISGIEPAGR